MTHSFIRAVLCGLLTVAPGAYATAQTRVEAINTAMNHMTAIQVPEEVENVAVGSQQIHVEWNGNTVLIQPAKPGIKTNMIVFTRDKNYDYEILPANDPSEMTMVVKEPDPPRPAPPVTPTHEEVQRNHDALYADLLMTARPVNTRDMRRVKHVVAVKVDLVSQDDDNYYIRLCGVNRSNHTYRLQTPKVMKLDPHFGVDVAYDHINRQIGEKTFRKFRSYTQEAIEVHASSLTMQDMPQDTEVDFVIAIKKPKITPAMFRFTFPSDDGKEVSAIAIF